MPTQMHLLGFLIHGPINHTLLSWADPRDERVAGLSAIRYWQDLARLFERGCFDGVFFADLPGVADRYRERVDEAIRYGVCWPTHDPAPLVAIMAAATEHLGIAITLSLSAHHPYAAVRTLSTLDCLTGGRVGWNIVTGHVRGEHRAYGLDQLEHDERYARAEEYMEVCYALWNSIGPGAIRVDRAAGVFADPARVRRVTHQGRYFRTDTVGPTLPSPQHHPVLFQAGSSGRGQQFALRHAEVIFSIQPHAAGMHRFMQQLREAAKVTAARAQGRTEPVRVTFAVQPILGGTEEEARRHQRELAERIPIEAGLCRLSNTLGVDFSRFDLDQPLDELDTQASRGMMAAMSGVTAGRRVTLREAAMHYGASTGILQIPGTPEQVADQLVALWRATGCFGFNVTPTINNSSIADFVDQVVPLLQRQGALRTGYRGRTFRDTLNSREQQP